MASHTERTSNVHRILLPALLLLLLGALFLTAVGAVSMEPGTLRITGGGSTWEYGDLVPEGTDSFSLTVPNEVEEVLVKAAPLLDDGETNPTAAVNGIALGEDGVTLRLTAGIGTEAVFTFAAEAAEGTVTRSYTVMIYRKAAAALTDLTVSGYPLTREGGEGFSPDVLSYTVDVPHEVTSVAVVPAAADGSSAEVTGSGELKCGVNAVTVTVTAGIGNARDVKTYTILVNRAGEASLTSLNVVGAAVDGTTETVGASFPEGSSEATVTVPYRIASVRLSAVSADPDASVTGTGDTHALDVGANGPFTVTVVSGAGAGAATRTYSVTVIRQADSRVSGISFPEAVPMQSDASWGTGAAGFSPDVLYYRLEVPYSVSSLAPSVDYDHEVLTVKLSGFDSLSVGTNTATVTASLLADPSVSTVYTFRITRDDTASSSAELSGLTFRAGDAALSLIRLSGCDGMPVTGFTAGIDAYALFLTADRSELTLAAETADRMSSVSVSVRTPSGGTEDLALSAAGDGAASGVISVGEGGKYTVTVRVTAEDGRTTEAWTVTVVKPGTPASSDSALSHLSIPGHEISRDEYGTMEGFDSTVTTYYLTVPYGVDALTVSAAPASDAAVMAVDVPPLQIGANTLTVTVFAEDYGADPTHFTVTRIHVTRENETGSDATLALLRLLAGTREIGLTPAFDPSVTSYAAAVSYDVTTLQAVTETTDENAAVTVETTPLRLEVGENLLTVTVTSANGKESRVYTVNVTRQAPALSSNANLASLTIGGVVLTPAFSPDVTSYRANVNNSVTSLTVTAAPADAGAIVSVSGQTGLAVGANDVRIVVTAADGTRKTYTVTVTRAKESSGADPNQGNAELASLRMINETTGQVIALSPAFKAGTYRYTASANRCESVSIVASMAAEGATWRLGNGSVGTVYGGLVNGENTITVVTYSADKSASFTYRIVLTVTGNDSQGVNDSASDTTLTAITLDGMVADLTPAFSPEVREYVLSVLNEISSVTVSGSPASSKSTASARTYDLHEGDNQTTVTVTAADGSTSVYSVIIYRTPAERNVSGVLVISGTPRVGSPLTATLVSGDSEVTVQYVWTVDGAEVARGATYTPVTADMGKSITVRAEGTGLYAGSVSATSSPVGDALETDVGETAGPKETDGTDTTPSVKSSMPPALIALLVIGGAGLIASIVLFFLRRRQDRY